VYEAQRFAQQQKEQKWVDLLLKFNEGKIFTDKDNKLDDK